MSETSPQKASTAERERPRVLLVGIRPELTESLVPRLLGQYEVEMAPTPRRAKDLLQHQPDLILLEPSTADRKHSPVIAALSRSGTRPLLVIAGAGDEADKVSALDAGAADYIVAPFGVEELMARIRAALRRNPDLAVESITTRSLVIDLRAKRVTRSGRRIHLTPIEWHILEVLARRPGSLITHQELLAEVWGPRFEDRTNYLRVHISAIRKKLEPVPHAPVHLTTEPGLGYRLEL